MGVNLSKGLFNESIRLVSLSLLFWSNQYALAGELSNLPQINTAFGNLQSLLFWISLKSNKDSSVSIIFIFWSLLDRSDI